MTATTTRQPNIKKLYSSLCAEMKPYIMFRIAQRVQELTPELTEKGRPPIKMSIGAPTVKPPQAIQDKLVEAMAMPGTQTYSTPRGEAFFREAVAKRMNERFGVTVDPKTEICSLIGSKEGLAAMFRAVVTPKDDPIEKDIILIPDPGYASYGDAIRIAGGLPYSMPLNAENNYCPDMHRLMQELNNRGYNANNVKALVLNYPSNPIGAMAPMSYFEDVVAFAREHNILIISDIAYSEMVFGDAEKPHSILEVEGARDIAIEFHSLSKPYAITGWRLGFAVGHEDAISILATVKSTMDSGIWKALQHAGAFALNSPECAQFVADMNKVYEANQAFMVEGFKKLGWPAEALNVPKATFYFWIPIPPRFKTSTEFANAMLEKAGIVVVPGTAFGPNGEGYVRLSLVNPKEELQAVLDRMAEDGFTYNG
jgi:LL-diaminopimelate aminotransferase